MGFIIKRLYEIFKMNKPRLKIIMEPEAKELQKIEKDKELPTKKPITSLLGAVSAVQKPNPITKNVTAMLIAKFITNKFHCMRNRRTTYPHQNVDDGTLDSIILLFYAIPAFSRNPLLLLIRYF